MKFSDFDAVTATNLNERAVTEFADSTRIHDGDIANHGMVGTVKVLRIMGGTAEVVDRNGKHLKMQLSSLRPGPMEESTVTETEMLSMEQFANYVLHTYYVYGGNDENDITIEDGRQKYRIRYNNGSVEVYPDEPDRQTRQRARQIKQEILTQADHGQFDDQLGESAVTENYEKHSAAAAKHDNFIETGNPDEEMYKAAIKHHERAARTAPSETLRKVHTRKAEQYFTKSKSTNESVVTELSSDFNQRFIHKANKKRAEETEKMHKSGTYDQKVADKMDKHAEFTMKAKQKMIDQAKATKKEGFPYDVDHMNGPILRNAPMVTDNVRVTNLAEWQRATNSINSRLFDDNCEFISSGERKRVVSPTGDTIAIWDDVGQVGWFNARGHRVRAMKESTVAEAVDAAALHVGDPVKIIGNVQGAGERGTFVDAGVGGAFVVVRLEDGSKHSYHSSNVEYDEGDDEDDEYYDESMKELAMPYSEFKDKKMWTSVARKAGHSVETASNGSKLHAYSKHGHKVGTFDNDTNKGHIAGSSVNESVLTTVLNEYGQGYGRERWDTNTQGYQDREQGYMDQSRRNFKRDEMEHELGHERNNYAVNIDGRQWKVFYDQRRATNVARSIMQKYPNKKVSVHATGAPVSEAAKPKQQAAAPRNFVAKNAKMGGAGAHKDHKRAAKQGEQKHKGKLEEAEDGYAKVEKAIAQHKRTLANKLASPANVTYAQKMVARGREALKKETGEAAYKHFQGGNLDESALIEADLAEISKPLRDRYVSRAVSAHGDYNMARRHTQGKDQEQWARKEQNTKKGIARALSDERQAKDAAK